MCFIQSWDVYLYVFESSDCPQGPVVVRFCLDNVLLVLGGARPVESLL